MTSILVPVATVARYLRVSTRRVRALLESGRMRGCKNPETGHWSVDFPPVIQGGSRGPRLGQKPSGLVGHEDSTRKSGSGDTGKDRKIFAP